MPNIKRLSPFKGFLRKKIIQTAGIGEYDFHAGERHGRSA
jgi:hypothetical protein